jgi:DNA-directed RNA polymerase specialized sigma subunit
MIEIKEKLNINEFKQLNDIESWLYNYKSIKVAIENLQSEYDSIEEPTLAAIGYSNEGGKSNKFNSTVENHLSRRELLGSRINSMTRKLEQFDRALKVLNETEYKIISNFYIENKRYYEFIHELGFGERTCKRIKISALEKILIGLNGV